MDDKETSLVSHIEALRHALIRMLAAVAILYAPAYMASRRVMDALVAWAFPSGSATLHYFAPFEVFMVRLKLALAMSIAASYPWIVWQAWRFLAPALYRNERKALASWIVASSLLFFGGAAFCAGFILPLLMRFSMNFATDAIQPVLGLAPFLNLAGWMSLAFGVVFQTPVAVMVAVRFGLVRASTLAKARPYLYTALLVVAAFLTPPDVVSQLMLAVPTALLLEAGLFLSKRIERKAEGGGRDG